MATVTGPLLSPLSDAPDTERVTRHNHCPVCERETEFAYIGDQHWPAELTRHARPVTFAMWDCMACGTTLSDLVMPEGAD